VAIRRRTGLIGAGIAALLLLVVIFVAPALIRVDRYRPQVISYLQEKTGKQVEIGRLALTFFPVSIHIDHFGVKNPPIFPRGYVVQVARIDLDEHTPPLARYIPLVNSTTVIAERALSISPWRETWRKVSTAGNAQAVNTGNKGTPLREIGVEAMTVIEVRGYGRQKDHTEVYRGREYVVDLIPKIKLEIVLPDALAENVVATILKAAKTGKIADGKIFVSKIDEGIRIRNGESGETAL
jgi:nitrogen regulatory protein P-II 1